MCVERMACPWLFHLGTARIRRDWHMGRKEDQALEMAEPSWTVDTIQTGHTDGASSISGLSGLK